MNPHLVINGTILEAYTGKQIKKVEVPEGITTIGANAFKAATSIEKIILPSTLTTIENNAFKGCRKLADIELPESLLYIGEYAFHRCHSLKSIRIPEAVTELSRFAFLYCDNLETVEILGVPKLMLHAFENNDSLTCLKISSKLEDKFNKASPLGVICQSFTGCIRLSKIYIDEREYILDNIIDVLHSGPLCPLPPAPPNPTQYPPIIRAIILNAFGILRLTGTTLDSFSYNMKHVSLPNGITTIGKSCFYNMKGIISIKLPPSVKKIDSRAFRNCNNLVTIQFTNDDVEINEDAFRNCTTLTKVILADGVTYDLTGMSYFQATHPLVKIIHKQIHGDFFISGTILIKYYGKEEKVFVPEGITIIGAKAFAEIDPIRHIVLPESVEEIHDSAFTGCKALQSINIPESVHRLGRHAFEGCGKLLRIILPNLITTIEKNTFSGCRSLIEIEWGASLSKIDDHAFNGCTALSYINIGEKLTYIGGFTFFKCKGLQELNLPKTLSYIGEGAFSETGIKSAVVECETGDFSSIFSGCNRLTNITFREGVRTIGKWFALKCGKLTTVEIPNSMQLIGFNAFKNTSFWDNLPSGIYNNIIETQAFNGCTYKAASFDDTQLDKNSPLIFNNALISGKHCSGMVVIPYGVITISPYAFCGNEEITTIKFPKTLKSIGCKAFWKCKNLDFVWFNSQLLYVGVGAFGNCKSLKQIAFDVLEIKERAFSGCCSLEKVLLSNVAEIEKGTFELCAMLEEFYSPDTKIIRDKAFFGCESLKTFNFDNVSYVGKNAFEWCDSLEELYFLGNTEIESHAFLSCGQITRISFSNTLKYASYAFQDCTNLRYLSYCEGGSKETHNINGYDFLTNSDDEIPTFAKALYLDVLSSFSITGNVLEKYHCNGQYICIPHGIERIGEEAFKDCDRLKDIEIPQSCTIIDGRAFEGTTWLNDKIDFLEQHNQPLIVIVNDNLVDGSQCVGDVIIPDTVKYVSGWAFANNSNLLSIEFSSCDTRINKYAFRNCINLQYVTVDTITYELSRFGVAYDPLGLPEVVQQIFQECYNCFKVDENGHLYECTGNIETLILPRGIKSIGNDVFKDSNLLTHIVLTSDVVSIGDRAFENCKWLKYVTKGTNVFRVGKKAFIGCKSLTVVQLPEDIVIEDDAFKWSPATIQWVQRSAHNYGAL